MRVSQVSGIVVFMCGLWIRLGAQPVALPTGCVQETSAQIACIKFSPVVASGKGKAFGPYYTITSEPAPAGYALKTVKFELQGPHQCSGTNASAARAGDVYAPGSKGKPGGTGSFSDCYQDSMSAKTTSWKFSIQGDDSYVTGVSIAIPDIPPVKVEKNGVVKGRAKLTTMYEKS